MLLIGMILPACAFSQQPETSGDPAQDQPSSIPNAESPLVTVHGTVSSATGEPLPRALVHIEGDAEAGALTDGEGRFEIPGVPAGPQTFQIRKPGFFDHPSSLPAELSEDPSNLSHNILVAAGMRDIAFTMAPYCAIRGQIDLSSGDPADGIVVQLLRRIVEDGRGSWQVTATTKTNHDGAYRFGNLQDGIYMLHAMPALDSQPATNLAAAGSAAVQRLGYPSVFYPDSRDRSGATKIHLTGGDQAQANFTLALEPFYSVTASAAIPHLGVSRSSGPAQFTATLFGAGDLPLPYDVQFDPQTGTLQTVLPSGSYTLFVSGGPNLQRQFVRAQTGVLDPESVPPVFNGYLDFTVAGHPIAGLRVPIGQAPSNVVNLTVSRTASSNAAAAGERGSINVLATPAGDAIGRFSFFAVEMSPGPNPAMPLPPGSYWLRSDASGQELCEQSFTVAGTNLTREPLTVSPTGAAPPVELVLRDNCARLSLSLPDSLAGFLPGEEPSYTVLVVPDFDSTQLVEPQTLRPSSGSVTVQHLRPGSYRVYTLDGPVRIEYRNPAVLAGLSIPGQQIVLSEGATANLVLEVPQK